MFKERSLYDTGFGGREKPEESETIDVSGNSYTFDEFTRYVSERVRTWQGHLSIKAEADRLGDFAGLSKMHSKRLFRYVSESRIVELHLKREETRMAYAALVFMFKAKATIREKYNGEARLMSKEVIAETLEALGPGHPLAPYIHPAVPKRVKGG